MTCPSCNAAMTEVRLEAHGGRAISIDLCGACHAFWFDSYESLQLSPASTLRLFTRIGELSTGKTPAIGRALHCPRCSARLLPTHDRQQNTPFEYWRCDSRHGRFITFFNFLREKSFIKTLSAVQLAELRQNLQIVNCSNCGGPIDLASASASACGHCGSPVSMLDMKQAEGLIAQLKDASAPQPIDPALPLNLMRARRETEAAFGAMEQNPVWLNDASTSGLVEASLRMITRWLNRRV